MPFGDRTGPQGLGPRTGRGAGYCSGFGMPGSMNPVPGGSGFGLGRGRGIGCRWFGGGRGWRNWYRETGLPRWERAGYGYHGSYAYGAGLTVDEEMDFLKNQAGFLKKQLDEIENRISTLEKSQGQGK